MENAVHMHLFRLFLEKKLLGGRLGQILDKTLCALFFDGAAGV